MCELMIIKTQKYQPDMLLILMMRKQGHSLNNYVYFYLIVQCWHLNGYLMKFND
jgi:hypothetical protein